MSREKNELKDACCATNEMIKGSKCVKVDAIVEVDKRGQILLPKVVREKAHITPGERFVLIRGESEGEVCCLTLIKAKYFLEGAKNLLGPIMKDIFE
ncbi:MAG: HgcAB-associated protein HgcC [Promethearchaeota archaeon]